MNILHQVLAMQALPAIYMAIYMVAETERHSSTSDIKRHGISEWK
jgi:hypothetical protein